HLSPEAFSSLPVRHPGAIPAPYVGADQETRPMSNISWQEPNRLVRNEGEGASGTVRFSRHLPQHRGDGASNLLYNPWVEEVDGSPRFPLLRSGRASFPAPGSQPLGTDSGPPAVWI